MGARGANQLTVGDSARQILTDVSRLLAYPFKHIFEFLDATSGHVFARDARGFGLETTHTYASKKTFNFEHDVASSADETISRI